MSVHIKFAISALVLTIAATGPARANTGTHDNCRLVASAAESVLLFARHHNDGQDYNAVVSRYNQLVSWCNRNIDRCYQRRVQRQKSGRYYAGVVTWELDYNPIDRTVRWSANCTN